MNLFVKAIFFAAMILFSSTAQAHPNNYNGRSNPVGLGITAGGMMQNNSATSDISFSGGFYTDIPLLSTFHITPSTTIYRYNGSSTTDVSLNFKFIVPLEKWEAMGGITSGMTSGETLVPHMGAFGGCTYNFVSNLDWFVSAGYNYVFWDDPSHNVTFSTGPLFRFQQ